MNSKRVVVAALLVAGIGFAWYATQNRAPIANTGGTMAGADRYQETQISDKDVQLTDASVQSFLQSDTFHKIQTNAEFRQLVTSSQFREAMRVEAFVGALEAYSPGAITADSEDKRIVSDSEGRKLVGADFEKKGTISADWQNRGIRRLPADYKPLRGFVSSYQLMGKQIRVKQWATLAANRTFRNMVRNGNFSKVAGSEGFAAAMEALSQKHAEAARAGTEGAKINIDAALSTVPDGAAIAKALDQLMVDAGSRAVVESAAFAEAFSSKEVAEFATSKAVMDLAGHADVWAFANAENLLQALSDQNVASIVADGSLISAVWDPAVASVLSADVFQKMVMTQNDALMSAVTSE